MPAKFRQYRFALSLDCRTFLVAREQEDEKKPTEHDGFFDMLRTAVETIEVGVTGIAGRYAVNGSASGDAVSFHLRNDAELRKGREPKHDDGDENRKCRALSENLQRPSDCEQENEDGPGRESFIVQCAKTLCDDGSGGVSIRNGTERSPGGDREKEQSAEPDDKSQPDNGAKQGFHATQGTGCREQGTGQSPKLPAGAGGYRVVGFNGIVRRMKESFVLPVLLAVGWVGGVPSTARAQTLLVANQVDRTVSVIDMKTGDQDTVAEGIEGQWGHEIAVAKDGRTAYLPIYGNSGVGKPGIDGQKMLVIDLGLRTVTGVVNFGHGVRPHLPVVDQASGMLYVTTELDDAVTEIDPQTLRIVGKVPTGQKESHMLVLSHDGKLGYTANVGPGTVSVLDMAGRTTVAVIPVAPIVQRIAISRDDRLVFTSDQTSPRLAVIDTAGKRVQSWVDLPGLGYGSATTPDGKWLLVAIPGKDEVAVVDLGAMKVARTVPVAADPQEILVPPDGRVAYVSCIKTGQVAAIDLDQWKVQKLLDAGKGADGLGWAP